ncbi:MAG: acyl carrier protein [Anaerolineales bacterium]|jgi:acyl carrier protein|nr:acyl carrier protein [Anaerolineales bacterium]
MTNITHSEKSPLGKSPAEIQEWLVNQVASLLYVDPGTIDPQASFNSFGLSSRDAVMLSGDLEEWLDRRFSPTLVYEYPTIAALTEFLASEQTSKPVRAGNPAVAVESNALLDDRLADLEQLSDEEAEALLLERLNKLNEKRA